MSIHVERIVEPRSRVNVLIFLIALPMAFTIVGVIVAIPLLLIARSLRTESMNSLSDKRFRQFIGKPIPYFSIATVASRHSGRKLTATGIAYGDRVVYLMTEGLAARIPWEDVRRWRWRVEGYETTEIYGGVVDTMKMRAQAAATNERARLTAYHGSGFFVEVADLDHPEWQFTSTDTALLKRWHEIFTQVSEGRIA